MSAGPFDVLAQRRVCEYCGQVRVCHPCILWVCDDCLRADEDRGAMR